MLRKRGLVSNLMHFAILWTFLSAVCGWSGQGFGATTKKKATLAKKSISGQKKWVRSPNDRQIAGKVSKMRSVPKEIKRPDYAESGMPTTLDTLRPSWMIETKSASDIEKMRQVGSLAREVLDLTGQAVTPGITTEELDIIAHEAIIERGAYPSPLNYHGFPKSICTSVNEVICHGIPNDQPLHSGDIINLDITVYYNGFHGDCSEMFFVDQEATDQASKDLIQCTFDAWRAAIDFCKPGQAYKDIGAIIDDIIIPKGYQSVKQFCGHGIGKLFHTAPNVLHYKNSEPNGIMAPGHVFTIEPMICEGTQEGELWQDNWTCTTKDLGRSAQFEHTLLITESGVEALTAKIPGSSPIQPWERPDDSLQFGGRRTLEDK